MVDAEFKWQHNRDMHDAAERLQELQGAVERNLEGAAEEIGLRVMATARRHVNVDTGRLRASINQEVERVTEHTVRAIVESNVEYAPFVEMDYPYLRPAFEENRDAIREIVADALQAAVEETE